MHPIIAILLSIFVLAAPPSKPNLVKNTLLSVVKLSHPIKEDPEHSYICTGTIINAARGLVLTAEHCVDGVGTTVMINDDLPAEVVKTSETLALVKIPVMFGPPLDVADNAQVGDDAVAFGYGLGEMHALFRHVSRVIETDIEIDGVLIPGMSGGPIVNESGKLIGVSQMSTDTYHLGLACGPKEIKDFLKGA